MIRRWARLAAALLIALLAAGCWDRVEVNDLAVVTMLAIDQTEEGDLQLWVQVVIPSRTGHGGMQHGGAGGGDEAPNFITLSETGQSVLDAARSIQLGLSRRIFFAHTRVVLIGERLARAGVGPAVDFLTRHREMRLTNYVLVARGDVAEIMKTAVDLERLPVEYIREISRSRIGMVTRVGEWVEMLTSTGIEPSMGVVEVVPPPPGSPPQQLPSLRLGGTALFRRDKLVGFIDDRITRGLLWLTGKIHHGVVTIEPEEAPGAVSLEWLDSETRRQARLERGRVTIYVHARTEGDISEQAAPLDLSDPETVAKVQAQLGQDVKRRMEAAIATLKELNVDAAGFGEVVRRQLPGVWKRLEKTWLTEGFREAKVVVTVDAKVRRTGLSSKPKGLRDEELIREGGR